MTFPPRSLYAAFDVFPSSKGSSIHIEHMNETLSDVCDGGILFVLGDGVLPSWQQLGTCEIIRFQEEIPNFLERTMRYGHALEHVARTHRNSLEIVHFRDPWSGIPLLNAVGDRASIVFEINGLPSIELPYHYPGISERTLRKIRDEERTCWERADSILVPSRTIAENLVDLGAASQKITVIPNGAVPRDIPPKPDDAPSRYILYFGALQRWQGVETLLRAMARLTDLQDLSLLICSSSRHRHSKWLRKLAANLDLEERVVWKERLHRSELLPYLANAELSVAPLTECARNIRQGCCPLKVLESMATGVPVIASDLPCIKEIMQDGNHGRLVPADRPGELARAIRLLLEQPGTRARMGAAAKQHIAENLTWELAQHKLEALYQSLLAIRSPINAGPVAAGLNLENA